MKMFPLNPKKLQGMLKQLGMNQEQIDAKEVIVKCTDRQIIVKEPNVSRIKFQGQDMLQVSGRMEEKSGEAAKETEGEVDDISKISEEDIKTVTTKTNVGKKEAKAALEKNNGDLAAAILELTG